jgi:hypothetical protein
MSALLTRKGTQARTAEPGATAASGPRHRIRQTVREMNYAARRVVELQAPWSVDQRWQNR